jgi:hypothetical protein
MPFSVIGSRSIYHSGYFGLLRHFVIGCLICGIVFKKKIKKKKEHSIAMLRLNTDI